MDIGEMMLNGQRRWTSKVPLKESRKVTFGRNPFIGLPVYAMPSFVCCHELFSTGAKGRLIHSLSAPSSPSSVAPAQAHLSTSPSAGPMDSTNVSAVTHPSQGPPQNIVDLFDGILFLSINTL
jgi:hypothetical protein